MYNTVYNKCSTCLEPSAIGIEVFHGLATADARMADLKIGVLVFCFLFLFLFSASDFDSGSIFFSFFPHRSFSVFLVRTFFSLFSLSFFLFLFLLFLKLKRKFTLCIAK